MEYCFKHSTKLRKSIPMQRMLHDYGAKGYGLYWFLIEIMATQPDNKIDKSMIPDIAKEIELSVQYINCFVEDCIASRLFAGNEESFKNAVVKLKKVNSGKRLYNVDVDLWYEIRNKVFKRDNYTCYYCGKVGGKLEVDHKIPFSKGGKDTLDNLVTACRRCNRQKKDKDFEEFIFWKALNG